MAKTQQEQSNSGNSRKPLIISIIALVTSGLIGLTQVCVMIRQAEVSEKLTNLSREQFSFLKRERTMPLQGVTLGCFHNLSTYFEQIKRFPKVARVAPLETNGEQYFSPSATVLEFGKKLKKAEMDDRMFFLDEDTHQSQEKKVIDEFLQRIANQRSQDNTPNLFAENGELKCAFLIRVFNPREVKVDVTEISCDVAKWRDYLMKKKGKDWVHFSEAVPPGFFSPPRICSFDSNEWKVCNIPVGINSKTQKYLLVVFDSGSPGNVLETVKSELDEGSQFMRLNQTLLNYLNSFRGIEVVVRYEDKKLILPPSSTMPRPKSVLFEEGFPDYGLLRGFMSWDADELFEQLRRKAKRKRK